MMLLMSVCMYFCVHLAILDDDDWYTLTGILRPACTQSICTVPSTFDGLRISDTPSNGLDIVRPFTIYLPNWTLVAIGEVSAEVWFTEAISADLYRWRRHRMPV